MKGFGGLAQVRTTYRFLLNGALAQPAEESGTLLVDWLRRDQGLTGTKEGCREGDCGACLVLLGEQAADKTRGKIEWIPVASCLLALGELDGRHVITVEGLASAGPTPVMKVLHEDNASQCGFCSPGVVVAITARLIAGGPVDDAALASALEGNLCRCTGYGAIRRACARLAQDFADLPADFEERLAVLASRGVVPPALAETMKALPKKADVAEHHGDRTLGGGTDWFVRHPDPEPGVELDFSDRENALRTVKRAGSKLRVGAAVTIRDFFASEAVRAAAPGIEKYEDFFASPPIRSRATVAGNIANASPVADMTALLLALGARIVLRKRDADHGAHGPEVERELALEDFFLGYKKTAAKEDERIEAVVIPDAAHPRLIHFEKAARRARLDIATVNTALSCVLEGEGERAVLRRVRVSAGGVGPTPLVLKDVSAYLEGKSPTAEVVREAARLARSGTKPISDARGSAEYRSDLVERLVIAHFLSLFPDRRLEEVLFA